MNDKICNTVKNKRNKKIEVIEEKIKKTVVKIYHNNGRQPINLL